MQELDFLPRAQGKFVLTAPLIMLVLNHAIKNISSYPHAPGGATECKSRGKKCRVQQGLFTTSKGVGRTRRKVLVQSRSGVSVAVYPTANRTYTEGEGEGEVCVREEGHVLHV